jgi:hypothetical protein
VDGIVQLVRGWPLPLRLGVVGAVSLGLLGSTAGLLVGLHVYPPTAWAATFEIGIPAAVLGSVLGVLVGLMVLLVERGRGS